jgi:hypothetical protein
MLGAVDTDADPETFNKQVITVGKQIESMLVDRYGAPPEYANMAVKYMFQSGSMSREAIRQQQVKMGIRKPEEESKPQTRMGKLNRDLEEGLITKEQHAQEMAGFEKKTDTPKTAMGAFLRQRPDATPEEIAGFAQKLKGKGARITLPDGTTMELGGAREMTTKTKGAIEDKLLSSKEQLERIRNIKEEFRPEFQEIGARLESAWTGMRSKLGQDVSKEEATQLTEFKSYQRKSIENINKYIKEMTGAQMSEKEADRLRLAQPDPGEKWWQGDDPITFKAKLEDVEKYTRAAIARYEYYKSKGLTGGQIKAMIKDGNAVSLESLVTDME